MCHMCPLRLRRMGSVEVGIMGEAVEEAGVAGMGIVVAEDEGGSR